MDTQTLNSAVNQIIGFEGLGKSGLFYPVTYSDSNGKIHNIVVFGYGTNLSAVSS